MALAKLETAAKYVGAVVTILGALAGAGRLGFEWAMADRDREAADMREEIDTLKTAHRELVEATAADLADMNNRFFDVRLALEALRVQVAYGAEAPAAPVRVTRSRRPVLGRPPAVSGTNDPAVVELHDPASAEIAYDDAMGRLEEL